MSTIPLKSELSIILSLLIAPDSSIDLQKLLERLDRNGDEQISLDEFSPLLEGTTVSIIPSQTQSHDNSGRIFSNCMGLNRQRSPSVISSMSESETLSPLKTSPWPAKQSQ